MQQSGASNSKTPDALGENLLATALLNYGANSPGATPQLSQGQMNQLNAMQQSGNGLALPALQPDPTQAPGGLLGMGSQGNAGANW